MLEKTSTLKIQMGFDSKTYKVSTKSLFDCEEMIEYYGYDQKLNDYVYMYSDKSRFEFIDLFLSNFCKVTPPLHATV